MKYLARLRSASFSEKAGRQALPKLPEGAFVGFGSGLPPVVQEKRDARRRGETLPDNRRTCRQCANLRAGICTGQSNGGKLYRPQVDTLVRCEWYEPGPDDADRRPAAERWPGLT